MAAQQQLQIQLSQFWKEQLEQIQAIDPDKTDFKTHELPLARIKKIMKMDDEIDPAGPRFMISAEAPAVFAKACEIFILELTLRSWTVTEESKRRTLQRTDVAQAVQRSDMYDFLIDIVPREEVKQPAKKVEEQQQQARAAPQHGVQLVDSTQYIYLQQQSPGTAQAIQIQHLLWQQQLAQQAYVIQTQQQTVGGQGVAPPPLPPLPDHQQHQPPPPQSQRVQDGRSREQDEEEDDDDDDDEEDEEEGEEEEERGAASGSLSRGAPPPPLPSHQSPAGLGVRQDRRPPPPADADGRASHLLHVVPVGGGGTGGSPMSAPPTTQPMHDAPRQLPNGHSSNSSQQQAGRGRQMGF